MSKGEAERSHVALVDDQFGPQAAAYVASVVHAKGADLDALAVRMAGHGPARVLDLGSGGGHVSFTVAPHVAEVVAYDLSPAMLGAVAAEAERRGLANVTTRQGMAEALPFADGSFDVVVSRYSAHHWRDARQGLTEARRVLKASGFAIFMDAYAPADPLFDTVMQGLELLRDPSHVRDYSLEEWRRYAAEAGFIPGAVEVRRLPLEFASWVKRIGTDPVHVAAIRSLQTGASAEVARYFEFGADGSWTIDTMTLECAPA